MPVDQGKPHVTTVTASGTLEIRFQRRGGGTDITSLTRS